MAVAVICEFNPFHNGHAYLLREARRLTGSPVVCVMSGSFTQRGEAAITDKFTRAAIALKNGADLVAELPAVYAVANAQRAAWRSRRCCRRSRTSPLAARQMTSNGYRRRRTRRRTRISTPVSQSK